MSFFTPFGATRFRTTGIRRRTRRLRAIGETAKEHPQRFWAYNNGITALVHDFEVTEAAGDGEPGETLKISGIAIVNGAQTTGALARVPVGDLADVDVLARFVKSSDPRIIHDIIRFNNSQSPIRPSDFRSRDPHQGRGACEMADAFEQIVKAAPTRPATPGTTTGPRPPARRRNRRHAGTDRHS